MKKHTDFLQQVDTTDLEPQNGNNSDFESLADDMLDAISGGWERQVFAKKQD